MSNIFQPKRVKVPGILSDEGLALAVKDFSSANQQTAAAAPANTSAVEFANKVVSDSSPQIDIKAPAAASASSGMSRKATEKAQVDSIGSGIASLMPASPLGDIGMLNPQDQAIEQERLVKQAEQRAADVRSAQELGNAMTERFRQDAEANPLDPAVLQPALDREAARRRALIEADAEVAAAKATPPTQAWWFNFGQVAARSAAQMGVGALTAPVDFWEMTGGALLNGGEIKSSEAGIWLDGVDAALVKLLPGDKARSKEFLTQLASGAGSMAGFMVAGFAAKAAGAPSWIASGGFGAASSANQLYEEADSFGANGLQKYLAFFEGAALGATEAIPLDRAFMRADVATGGLVRRMLTNTSATSLEEFLQEYAQTAGEDLVAKYGAFYDPDRELDAGAWLNAAAVGAITGAATGTVTSILGEPEPQEIAQVDEAKVTETVDAAIAEADTRFASVIGEEGAALAAEDAEPGSAGEMAPTAGAPQAGAPAPVAGPDPVAGDTVTQIVERAKPPKVKTAQVATGGAQTVVLDASVPVEQQVSVQVAPAVETPQFKQWFGKSKVVDEAGQPQVVYHGTRAEKSIGAFSMARAGSRTDEGYLGQAVYFTDKANVASIYAGDGSVYPVYLALQNPLVLEARMDGKREVDRALLIRETLGLDPKASAADVADAARAAGYDGVSYTDPFGGREFAVFDPESIKSAIGNDGSFDANDPNIDSQIGRPADPDIVAQVDAVQLEPHQVSPLPDIEKGLTGPIPRVVQAAKAYAAAAGIPHHRAREYVKVDVARATRIAQAYADMKHDPQNPAVAAAYQAMAEETLAQYQYVKATGLKIDAIQEGQPDPYPAGPRDVLKDINAGHIWYYPTKFGFGSDASFDPATNPLLEPTTEVSDNGEPMLVNDVFRVVHDFFGHGLEGSGFGARGEENAWQSHMRLFSASAVPAMTSETRGQNSWVNYGPYGAANRADRRNTVYADQKSGIMPSWTWEEGVVDSQSEDVDAPAAADTAAFRGAFASAKAASPFGAAAYLYDDYSKFKTFLTPDGLSGFALDGENIVSVFSHPDAPRGRLRKIIDVAVANGGRKLDAFDGNLTRMYSALGFVETGRVPFDPAQAPADWPASLGTPDVVFMEYGDQIENLVAAPLFGDGRLPVIATGKGARPLVKDVAQALTDRHLALEGRKLFPEDSEEDYAAVLEQALDDFTAQVSRPGSGIGWYSTDVSTAVALTQQVFPTLEQPAQRDLYLTFAGIFSNGATPEQAWGMSAEAYTAYLESGTVPTARAKGKWGVRDAANNQQLALIKYMIEREGGLEQAMAWFKGQQKRTDINAIMTESGLYKAGRFTTKAEQQGEAFGFLALGEKLGRYTLGLHGVELEADNTTVDLWYTRTFRRWTGRLFDAPISAEGIAGGVNSEKERSTIFRITGDIHKQYPDITAGDVQAVLWFFEKRLYAEHGVKTSEGTNSSGARKLLAARGLDAGEGGAREGAQSSGAGGGWQSQASADIDRAIGTSTTRAPYALEPTRPTKGIAAPAAPAQAQNDVRLTKIAANFRTLLKLTVRHGRLTSKGSNVMGEYNRRQATVRLRTWTDLSTLVHEGGHALNDSMAQPLDAFVNANRGQFSKIANSLYAGDLSNAPIETVLREGFAEFFRLYSLTPDTARNRYKQLTADFEAVLDANEPALKPGLNAIADQFKAWLQLPSGQLIENMVIDGRREQGIGAAIAELKELGFKSWMQEHTRRMLEASINRWAPLNKLTTDLLNAAEENHNVPLDLKRADDPRVIARLARNAGSRGMVQVQDGVIGYRSTQSMSRGLRDAIMVSQGVDPLTTPGSMDDERLHHFSAYLVARRSLDEFERYEAGDLERPPIGASKGDVIRAIKDYEAQYKDAFTDAARIVHEYGMALWQKQYDAGLITKETYEDGLKRKFYVPLQRDLSDKRGVIGPNATTTKGSGPLQSIVKRFRGSDRDIVDPLSVLKHKTFALEQIIAENDAKKALAILADKAGKAGALVERIPAHKLIGQQLDARQVAAKLTGDLDMSEADAADLMTLVDATSDRTKLDVITLFRSEQAAAAGENVLFFWENGKVAAIQLADGELGMDVVNTMNAIGRENMDLWVEAVAATSSVVRTAITSWPDYLIVNYLRDQLSAWVLSDVGFKPFFSGIRGMADEIRQKTWAKSYNAAGGIMGGMNVAALHKARVDRDINSLRSKGYIANVFGEVGSGWDFTGMIKGLGRITALSETGTRLGLFRGAYERGQRDGLSEYEASVEAAYIATDYIDFGLNGSRMLTARRLVPFLNAQLQGLYKMVRTLGGDEVAQRKGLKFALGAYFKNIKNLPLSRVEQNQLITGRKAWIKMTSLGFVSAALAMLFKDDPDYEEAGEYLRTTGWVIPMGGGRIFWIPKPFELAMVANAVERGIEFASGDATAPGRFMRGVAFNLSPPTTPPAFQVMAETAANFDFFSGREIVPSYMRGLEPQLQYDNYSTSFAKWLGRSFNWSPMMIDHVMSQMGASAYRDITTALNAADPSRPALDETDAPIIRRFVRDVRRGSASSQDFWAQASQTNGALQRGYQTYKRFVDNGNQPAANAYLAGLSADARGYALLMTHFKPEDKRLNPFYRATQMTTILSGMRRELSSELNLADTTIKDMPDSFAMSAGQKQQVDEILSELSRREVRNTLIATGQPGWLDKELLPIEPTLDMLLTVSPDAYDEYNRRVQKAKVYNAESVFELWPDVRERLIQDAEFAVLSDARAIAGAGI